MARAILESAPASDECYFQALGKITPFNGHSPCKRRLDKRYSVSAWTLHDLRRTFASGLASIGVSIPVIERLLNHVSGSFGGIVGVYQRYDFFPEMQAAIESWEKHIAQLVEISSEAISRPDGVGPHARLAPPGVASCHPPGREYARVAECHGSKRIHEPRTPINPG